MKGVFGGGGGGDEGIYETSVKSGMERVKG